MATADLLLEIGSEEIPAGYVARAAAQLGKRLTTFLSERGIAFDAASTAVFATPRRLAVRVGSVATRQPTRSERRMGPAVAAAFDGDGNPTPAAQGFARSLGVEVGALARFETPKGERLGLEVETGGAETRALLLADGFLRELLQLGFPKTMRWIPGDDFAYARPVRWLVCLLGDEVVPLRLAHLTAGRESRGHRTLHPRSVEIASPGEYESTLSRCSVEVRATARREAIREHAHRLAEEAGGRLHEADDLLEEVSYLVEHPFPVLGSYDPALVEALPREVIITAMRSHQRYFSVERPDGRLLPRFITFRDGGDHGLQNVVEGNERVLRARLDDALFYWNEDRASDSDAKVERLERVVWLEGVGSIADKCRRIGVLAARLRDALPTDADAGHVARAALLCKTDLATEMIKDGKEFTKLQGVMGRYYALEAGEPAEVADAIREHLHPRFATDRLPEGDVATLVALADRLDSIVGCVAAGFAPTGSADPYALRRQALATVRILHEREWGLPLEEVVREALDALPDSVSTDEQTEERVAELFWARLESYLGDLPSEIVRAVLTSAPLDPLENIRAAEALASLRGEESFAQLLEGAKRCRNILVKEKRLPEEGERDQVRAARLRSEAAARWERWQEHAEGAEGMGFRSSAFEDEGEHGLHRATVEAVPRLSQALAGGDHDAVYRSLAALGGPISRYFDEVLVNAQDAGVRANRLSFLEEVHYLFVRFADLSRVPAG